MLAFLLQRVQNRLNLRRDVFGRSEVRRPFADLCCPVLSSSGVDLSEQLVVRSLSREGFQLFGSTFSNIAVVMAAAVAFSARTSLLAVVIPSRLCMTPVSGSVQGSFVRS